MGPATEAATSAEPARMQCHVPVIMSSEPDPRPDLMTGAFTHDPVPDVRCAVQQLDPAVLAGAEEPHHRNVHQRHFLEIQRRAWPRAFELRLDFRQAFRLDPTDQPNDRASLYGNPFDAQHHWLEDADFGSGPTCVRKASGGPELTTWN
jgi:hypothetical protein